MPLSEHEQRLLEQIEQALYAEDPKFAHSWRTRSVSSVRRARLLRSAAVIVVGLGLLVAGVVLQSGSTVLGVAFGVAGFLLMLGGAWLLLLSRQRPGVTTASARAPRAPRRSWKVRLEERWERRQDGRR